MCDVCLAEPVVKFQIPTAAKVAGVVAVILLALIIVAFVVVVLIITYKRRRKLSRDKR